MTREGFHTCDFRYIDDHMASSSRMSDRRVQTVCLLILTLISIGVALWLLQPVLVPFVLALFFSQCLSPVIKLLMRRLRLPHVVAVTMAVLLGAGLLTGVGFILASSVGNMSDEQNFQQLRVGLGQFFQKMVHSRIALLAGIKPDASTDSFVKFVQDKSVEWISNVLASIAGGVRNGASVLLLMAFLLFGRRPRAANKGNPAGLIDEIENRVQRYISLTVFISALTGIFVGVPLSIMGVQFAAGFGFLAFLLNFIPNIGAVIATVLPLPIVLLDPHMPIIVKLMVFVIPTLVQVGIGSLVQPRMLGNSLELHPVVVLLSLLFFTMIWGVGGAFLATPLTAVIKIVLEKIPATRPLAAAMAGNLEPLTQSIDRSDGDTVVIMETAASSQEAGI